MGIRRAFTSAGLILTVVQIAMAGINGLFKATVTLLPTPPELYSAELELSTTLAGWELTSESKFYRDGWKYQNFYVDGFLGTCELWGKAYFHAAEVRYRKSWINLEFPLFGEDDHIRFSFNHWSSEVDYSSSDVKKFGPWPCTATVPWDQAWRYFGQEVSVEGPVVGYYYSGYLKINVGRDYPDPDRFEIYIPSDYVEDFEAVFGDSFWEDWSARAQVVCVTGTVEGYRWNYGGPRGEGYSVAQIEVTDPESVSVGPCGGTRPPSGCPGRVVRWFEAHMHDGETLWIQGPVVSISGPGTYWDHPGTYRVRIGGSSAADNRVEVIMTEDPGWSIEPYAFDSVVCVYGTITIEGDVAVIHPTDLVEAKEGPCCDLIPTPFINTRLKLENDPLTLTLDFGDCCTGLGFRRAEVELEGLSLCCDLVFDAGIFFSKRYGLEEVFIKLTEITFACCDVAFEAELNLSLDGKIVSVKPIWEGFATACLEIYGDVQWSDKSLNVFELYGFSIECRLDSVTVRSVTAFDPDAVEDLTDVSFYTGEWEYLGLEYAESSCCGELTFTSEFWFGDEGLLFGLQRVRFELAISIYEGFTAIVKGQWDFSNSTLLDWLDFGLKIEF